MCEAQPEQMNGKTWNTGCAWTKVLDLISVQFGIFRHCLINKDLQRDQLLSCNRERTLVKMAKLKPLKCEFLSPDQSFGNFRNSHIKLHFSVFIIHQFYPSSALMNTNPGGGTEPRKTKDRGWFRSAEQPQV